MSIRGEILDSVKTAIETVTDLKYVDTNIKVINELTMDQLPACMIVDGKERKETYSVDARKCYLEVICRFYDRKTNDTDNLSTRRQKILSDCESAIISDWQRGGKALNSEITEIDTDQGLFNDETIYEMKILVEYFHKRGNPDSQDNSPL